MFKKWLISLLGMLGFAAADSLIVIGNIHGLLPYYYGESLEKGHLVDVLQDFSEATGIESRFHPSPRSRHQWYLEQGFANAIFSNPAWLPMHDQLHLIGPLFYWQDRLFAQPGRYPEQDSDSLSGRICLRSGFSYSPSLEAQLGDTLQRLDADSNEILMRMFVRDRCDYAVMDSLEFQYRTHQGKLDPLLYQTSIIDAEWLVYLGILKTETSLIEAVEAYFTPQHFEFDD